LALSRFLRSPWLWLGLAAAILLGSCRATPLAPRPEASVSPADASPAGFAHAGRVPPIVRDLSAEVVRDTLRVRARLDPIATRLGLAYDPARAGGWALQLFMNTDQAPTGAWAGTDYLVRGSEVLPDGRFVIRRVAPGDEFPGGWGPRSGVAGFRQRPGDFVIAVPLADIGGDEGRLDFVLELYATVACDECAGGVTHEWAADYFGTTNLRRTAVLAGLASNASLLTRAEAARAGRFAAGTTTDRRRGDTARW
jgi:hypothetical protein